MSRRPSGSQARVAVAEVSQPRSHSCQCWGWGVDSGFMGALLSGWGFFNHRAPAASVGGMRVGLAPPISSAGCVAQR